MILPGDDADGAATPTACFEAVAEVVEPCTDADDAGGATAQGGTSGGR